MSKTKTTTLTFTRDEWEDFQSRVNRAWDQVDSGDAASITDEVLTIKIEDGCIKDGQITYMFSQYGEVDL